MKKLPHAPIFLSAVRTPIGRLGKSLASVRPDDMLALVLKEALNKAHLAPEAVDEVYVGCANQAGEDNRNIARMAVLLAGFPVQLPAVTVNRLCASGLEAIVQGVRSIVTGEHQVVICGGVESMSRAPWVMGKPDRAFPSGPPLIFDSALGWRFPNPKMKERFPLESMGETAENIAEQCGISRARQDEFALRSHQKAVAAQELGHFENEIIAVPVEHGQFSMDEGPRKNSSHKALSDLPPVFRKNGTVTAGNSSTLNDGASALVIASEDFAKRNGLPILGHAVGFASAGVDPRTMGLGPIASTLKLCERFSLSPSQFELIELNEAFAAQALAVIDGLSFPPEKVNPNGGAIALGHPLGCSGARIVTTLLHGLHQRDKELGLASLCVGVGQGLSMAIARSNFAFR